MAAVELEIVPFAPGGQFAEGPKWHFEGLCDLIATAAFVLILPKVQKYLI